MGTMYQVNQTTGEPSTPVLGGSSSGGGLTQEEHNWLKSIGSYMPNMYDINVTKSTSGTDRVFAPNGSAEVNMPVCGYDKVSLNCPTHAVVISFKYVDGTYSEETTLSSAVWSDYISIPLNAVEMTMKTSGSSANYIYYSLLTADSSYNPDNQTP